MPTYIDGIGASQNIDSSGEIVDIAGLDISSLEIDGSLNWEHKKDVPEQLVGRVLKAKKIFSDKDCEDDRQKYFWNKCKTPYLYILGVLFDDYVDSARHVAGIFRYDHDNRGKQERDTLGFSVEGAKLPGAVHGMTITRSIARKITITNFNCNKVAAAELAPTAKKPKDDKDGLDNIFKTESFVEIEVFKSEPKSGFWDLFKKESVMKKAKDLFSMKKEGSVGAGGISYGATTGMSGSGSGPSSPSFSLSEPDMGRSEEMTKALSIAKPHGTKIGTTRSGKDVMSHAKVSSYTGFSAADHADAAAAHNQAAKAAKGNLAASTHHAKKQALHMGASQAAAKAATKRAKPAAAPAPRPPQAAPPSPKASSLHDPSLSGKINYKKSETLAPGEQSDDTVANQKQQRVRRAQEAYPNSDKKHWDKHKINHSSSNISSQNQPRRSIPNKQILDPVPSVGAPNNNMLHNKLLAPRQTMHKAAGGAGGGAGGSGGGIGGGFSGGANIGVIDTSSGGNTPVPKKPRLGTLNKALEAGSSLCAPNMLTGGAALGKESLDKKMHKGGAYSGNVPKDKKIKELQNKIDFGTYKPDSKKTAEAMLKHPSKPLKKLEVLQKPYVSEAQRRWAHTSSGMEALGGKSGVHEWDEATKGKKLPERKSLKKSDAYMRAESEYSNWSKREEFESFMKSRMPHMTKGEIRAFGQAMLLNKSMRLEKSLDEMTNLNKAIGVHSQYNVGSKNDGPGTSLAGQLVRENKPGDKADAVHEHKKKLGELKAMPKPNLTKSDEWTSSKDHRGAVHSKTTATGHKLHVYPIPGNATAGHRVEHHSPHKSGNHAQVGGPTTHDVPGDLNTAKQHASEMIKCCM